MRRLALLFLALPAAFPVTIPVCRDRDGQTWTHASEFLDPQKAFVLRCTVVPGESSLIHPVACVTPNDRRIELGQSHQEGATEYICQSLSASKARLRTRTLHVSISNVPALSGQPTTQSPDGQGPVTWDRACFLPEENNRMVADGFEWLDYQSFVIKRCQVQAPGIYSIRPVACLSPSNNRIEPGESRIEGSREYFCIQKRSFLIVRSQAAPQGPAPKSQHRCKVNGHTKEHGEEWTENAQFVWQCEADENGWTSSVVACLTPSGIRVPIGQNKVEGINRYTCSKLRNMARLAIQSVSFVTVSPIAVEKTPTTTTTTTSAPTPRPPLQCLIAGKRKKDGETEIINNRYLERCVVDEFRRTTRTETIACLSPSGMEIKVGDSANEDGQKFHCLRQGRDKAYMYVSRMITRPPATTTTKRPIFTTPRPAPTPARTPAPTTRRRTPPPKRTARPTVRTTRKPAPTVCYIGGEFVKHGKEKIVQKKYVRRCEIMNRSANVVTVACLTRRGTRVKVAGRMEEDGLEYRCNRMGRQGAYLTTSRVRKATTARPRRTTASRPGTTAKKRENQRVCYINGRWLADGQEVAVRQYVKKCVGLRRGFRQEIVGCVAPSGRKIPIGKEVRDGKYVHRCKKLGRNNAYLQTQRLEDAADDTKNTRRTTPAPFWTRVRATTAKAALKTVCKVNGVTRVDGETWEELSDGGGFVKRCKTTRWNWSTEIIACILPKGTRKLKVGQTYKNRNTEYECKPGFNGAVSLKIRTAVSAETRKRPATATTPAPARTRRPTAAPARTRRPTPAPIRTRRPTPAPTRTRRPTPAPTRTRRPTAAPARTRRPTPAPAKTRRPTAVPARTRRPIPATEAPMRTSRILVTAGARTRRPTAVPARTRIPIPATTVPMRISRPVPATAAPARTIAATGVPAITAPPPAGFQTTTADASGLDCSNPCSYEGQQFCPGMQLGIKKYSTGKTFARCDPKGPTAVVYCGVNDAMHGGQYSVEQGQFTVGDGRADPFIYACVTFEDTGFNVIEPFIFTSQGNGTQSTREMLVKHRYTYTPPIKL